MGKTYAYQDKLPSLPVPELSGTKTKLLEWIEPIVGKEQFEETRRIAEEFFAEGGDGQKLQEKLREWDGKINGSWLKPFWDDMYLKYRGYLPAGMNFCMLLSNEGYKEKYEKHELAGKAIRLIGELNHLIADEEYDADTIKGKPLCMSQYRNFFRSIRIPRIGKDEHKVSKPEKKNNHVVLLYKKNMYKISISDEDGNIFSSGEIARCIREIFNMETAEGENVGIFTTAQRDEAAQIYDELIMSKSNSDNLEVIEKALAVICIDEESKNSQEALENLLLSGDNKYFDKTIQIVVTNSGEIGVNGEHTGIDGSTFMTIVNYVSDGLKSEKAEEKSAGSGVKFEKLEWEIGEELKMKLTNLNAENRNVRKQYHLELCIFEDFGQDEIKKLKISPDAFFHIALQVAQYNIFGKMRSTYEPVAVRFFKEGRTECARASSTEKLDFIKTYFSGTESNEVLYGLMQKASDAHAVRIKECQNGNGVERHMYGLLKMHEMFGEELCIGKTPAIFETEGYKALRYDFISTSGIGNKNVKHSAFGPVVEDGFGIFYSLMNDSISINISSKSENKENAKSLMLEFVQALRDIREIALSSIQ
ncbi:putative acetyltransferase [Peptoclostridium acidaminophilum DSM 3953]|uniref:Putative acetyltransferase n=1 Tax=Peptoclostridium acidaminophilum DSM 3953 TaxID=1286171 RepID=W8TIN7_PEPAC|nr:choline/carnitine O-acyltransferase [Peptoclostridium acidaminophilum]AHM56072.1 putative acetyltransferase [Peptoclostridium acidaminophilum DSM 3953]